MVRRGCRWGGALLVGAVLCASAAGAEEPATTTTTARASGSRTTTTATAPPERMVFPVAGRARYTNTFGAPRQGGKRKHEGQDLIGAKMTPLVSPVDGTVTRLTVPEPTTGYGLVVTGTDGWIYKFVHINNDSLGTDDGKAPLNLVYGPGIAKGSKVVAGQLVGFMGDSGNAEGTVPHLHFEVRTPRNKAVNPYRGLVDAIYLDAPVRLPAGYDLPPLGTTQATPKQKPKPCGSSGSTSSTTSSSTTSSSTTSSSTTSSSNRPSSTTSSTVAADQPDPPSTTTSSSTSTTAKPAPCSPAKKQPKKQPPKRRTTTSTTKKQQPKPTSTTRRR